jgi:hypothetical protein
LRGVGRKRLVIPKRRIIKRTKGKGRVKKAG